MTTTIPGNGSDELLFGDINAADLKDSITAAGGSDTLVGGLETDTLVGGDGIDTADYSLETALSGPATAGVVVNLGAGTATDGWGFLDRLFTIENLIGTKFPDFLTGDAGANLLSGLNRNDTLVGAGGTDTLLGGAGDDELRWFVGDGKDSLSGSTGIDAINFLGGNYGGLEDVFNAGTASIEAIRDGDGGKSHIAGDAGNQFWNFAGAKMSGVGGIDGGGGNDTIVGTASADSIDGQDGDDKLSGAGGTDTLVGGSGADSLNGGSGNDTMVGGIGTDTLLGGDNDDEFRWAAGHGVDVYDGGGGVNTIKFSGGNFDGLQDSFNAGATSIDFIQDADGGASRIVGNANAQLWNFSGAVTVGIGGVDAGGGNDTVVGTVNADRLNGQDGNDSLTGGLGADTLTGGTGKDTLRYGSIADSGPGAAHDTVVGFSQADGDRLHLQSIDANSTTVGDDAFSFIGNAAFTGVAGQLRFFDSGAHTLVQGDTDGNGVADFEVLLQGNAGHPLFVTDFVL
jgi:Ca2+-binding RTX toxin-like protein